MTDTWHRIPMTAAALSLPILASLAATPCMASPATPDEVTVELDGTEIDASGQSSGHRDLPRTDATENPVMGILAVVAVASGGVAIWARRKAR